MRAGERRRGDCRRPGAPEHRAFRWAPSPSLGGLDGLEWTNWAVVKVPAERRFLLSTSDLAWRGVDLSKIDAPKAHAGAALLYDETHRSFLPPALVTQ